MKIITWNCNMAFRKKADLVLAYKPDILIVPECEHPDKLTFKPETVRHTDVLWFGNNLNKGIGIFAYGDFRMRVMDTHNRELRMIVPIEVSRGKINFVLFAVWANNPDDPDGQYVEQVWKAIHHYDGLLTHTPVILTGDFNSNTIWDRPRRTGNHSAVVEQLKKKKIYSAYHKHFKQVQGREKHPTLYMYRHRDKPYHIDYCFASKKFINKLQSIEVGDYEFWTQYSDHVPVIATFRE